MDTINKTTVNFYKGRKIKLYPGDSYAKEGEIIDIDEFGWIIKITKSVYGSGYIEGEYRFISHSTPFHFRFLEKEGTK